MCIRDSRDTAHDFRHIERIINRLELLSREISPPPDKSLLYFLACFHGLGKNICDNELFCERAKYFLLDLKWNETQITKVFQSLERHTTNPQTIEETIIHDANYVELLGAVWYCQGFHHWRCQESDL